MAKKMSKTELASAIRVGNLVPAPKPGMADGAPSQFKTVLHPNAKPGEWRGHYAPVKPRPAKRPGSK